eukprot:2769672-Pleurochrysis_carterae.AAC.1
MVNVVLSARSAGERMRCGSSTARGRKVCSLRPTSSIGQERCPLVGESHQPAAGEGQQRATELGVKRRHHPIRGIGSDHGGANPSHGPPEGDITRMDRSSHRPAIQLNLQTAIYQLNRTTEANIRQITWRCGMVERGDSDSRNPRRGPEGEAYHALKEVLSARKLGCSQKLCASTGNAIQCWLTAAQILTA